MQIRLAKRQIPWLMASARAALGPVVVLGERCNWSGGALAAMVIAALVSDIYDGVLARRWKCDTAGVRMFDSMADTVFYACVGIALWFGRSPALRENAGLLFLLLIAELARYALDLAKFGKPASYHSWLAKIWGLLMAIAVVAAFATSGGGMLIRTSMAVGLLCNAEGFVISLILPRWTRDVKGFAAAMRLRREYVAEAAGPHRPSLLLTD